MLPSRWLIIFATTLLLWSLVGQLNHYLAPMGAFLSVGGLLVTFAALRLSLRNGLMATILIGLAVDAVEPVPTSAATCSRPAPAALHGCAALIFSLRTRFPREETVFGVVTALLANLGLFLGLSFIYAGPAAHFASGAFRSVCSPISVGRSCSFWPSRPGFSPFSGARWSWAGSTSPRKNPGSTSAVS